MFFEGNWDPKTNGEELFYNNIKDKINVIFDVGCSYDSILIFQKKFIILKN